MLKHKLSNSRFGHSLLAARRIWALRFLSARNPEKAGLLANAIIADRLIARLAPKGGTFLDIGAQYGAVFSLARAQDASLQVYAFEAETEKAEILRKTFPDVTVFDVAIGEQEGEATFYMNPQASGYNSLVPDETSKTVTVRVAAIDDLVPDVTADVIKIDIEGAELGALRGAENTVAKGLPVIMFESIMPKTNALGYSASDLWDWFNDHDYSLFTPERLAHDDGPPLARDAFIDAQQYPFRSHNYFGVAKARRIEVRDRAREILGVPPIYIPK